MANHSISSEIWRTIRGYAGKYEVSDRGRVRSSDGHLKATGLTNGGHVYVSLWVNNSEKREYVHRLLITEFVGAGEPGQEVRHLNGNPQDNRLVNLRWGTRSENMMDEVYAGRHWQTRKTHCKHGHEYTAENTLVRGVKRTQRVCRKCNERWQAEYKARKAASQI